MLFIGQSWHFLLRHFIAFPRCISPLQHFYDKLKSKDCSFCLRDCFCCVFSCFQRNFYGTARNCFQSRGKRNCTPRGPLTYFNDGGGGVRQRFIFHTQEIPTSEFVYPKKSLLFLAYPKKSLSVFASANFIIYLLK